MSYLDKDAYINKQNWARRKTLRRVLKRSKVDF